MRRRSLGALLLTAAAVVGALAGCGAKDEPDPSAPAPAITYKKTGGFAGIDEVVHISPRNRVTVTYAGKPTDTSAVPPALVLQARAAVADIDFGRLATPQPRAPGADEFQIALRYDGHSVDGSESQLLPLGPLNSALSSLDAIVAKAQPKAGKDDSGSQSGSG